MKEFSATLKIIEEEVNWLTTNWRLWKQLFDTSQEHIDLLNDSAPLLFHVIQGNLLDGIFLAITRLTDPAKQRKNVNMSLYHLCELVDHQEHSILKKSLEACLQNVEHVVEPIRDHRRKRIAHSDADVKRSEVLLPNIDKSTISKSIKLMHALLNLINKEVGLSHTAYEDVILPLGADGDHLIKMLKKAYKYDELVGKRHQERTLERNQV